MGELLAKLSQMYTKFYDTREHWATFEKGMLDLFRLYGQDENTSLPPTTVDNQNLELCKECHQVITGDSFRCVYCLQYSRCAECQRTDLDAQRHMDGDHLFIKIPAGREFTWNSVWQYRNSVAKNKGSLLPTSA